MIKRNERGRLSVDHLDVEIFFGELFEHCNTPREVDWLYDILEGCMETTRDERLSELGYEEDEDEDDE